MGFQNNRILGHRICTSCHLRRSLLPIPSGFVAERPPPPPKSRPVCSARRRIGPRPPPPRRRLLPAPSFVVAPRTPPPRPRCGCGHPRSSSPAWTLSFPAGVLVQAGARLSLAGVHGAVAVHGAEVTVPRRRPRRSFLARTQVGPLLSTIFFLKILKNMKNLWNIIAYLKANARGSKDTVTVAYRVCSLSGRYGGRASF